MTNSSLGQTILRYGSSKAKNLCLTLMSRLKLEVLSRYKPMYLATVWKMVVMEFTIHENVCGSKNRNKK